MGAGASSAPDYVALQSSFRQLSDEAPLRLVLVAGRSRHTIAWQWPGVPCQQSQGARGSDEGHGADLACS
jgi:hypothetical protein